MEQFKTDPHTGLRYELQGEYYVIAGDEEAEPTLVGIWGQKHLRFLRKTRPVTYTNLLTTGMLPHYLAGIECEAYELFFRLIEQFATAEGIAEQLKAANQMEWVGWMNNIRSRAEEIVLSEIVFT